jgi:hypothetical protein
MFGSEHRRAPGDRAIDRDDRDPGRIEELIDGCVGALLQRRAMLSAYTVAAASSSSPAANRGRSSATAVAC